jgi:hypothetical protein
MSALVSVHHHPAGFLEGRAQPGCGRHGEIIASFQSDIRDSRPRGALAEIAAAEHGEPQPGGAGNAFSIAIAPGGAVIRNAVIEGAVAEHYSLAELRNALEIWIAAIEGAPGSP